MNVQDAAFITGHDYPGGAEALGARIGIGAYVLSHKLNPNNTTHHLTLAEAMRIMTLTGDVRILHAMCSELHHMAIPLVTVGNVDLMAAMTSTIAEFAEFITAASEAMNDNKVTKLELREVNKELGDLMTRAGKLMAMLEAQEASRGR